MGMSVGISLMNIYAVHEAALTRARLVEGVRPDNPVVPWAMPSLDFGLGESLARIGGEVSRQAIMVGYVEAFYISGVIAFAMMPLVLFMRVRR